MLNLKFITENREEVIKRLAVKNFDEKEIAAAAETEVVKRLVNLIRFRNQHLAFEGDFTAQASSPTELVLSWKNDAERASLTIDLKAKTGRVAYTEDGQEKVFTI